MATDQLPSLSEFHRAAREEERAAERAAEEAARRGAESPPDPTQGGSGNDVADRMGLERETTNEALDAGCNFFVEVLDGEGYCLEGHIGSENEGWRLSYELRGKPAPSQLEEELFDLLAKGPPREGPERDAFMERVAELKAQISEED